jgi:PmbA protein
MGKYTSIELTKWAVDYAIKSGASEAAAELTKRRDVEVGYRDGMLENLKESTQNSLNLSIYQDNRYSSHTTNDLRKESMQKFIEEAIAATKYLSKDEFRKLPDVALYPAKDKTQLSITDDKYESVETDRRVAIAKEIQEAAAAESDKIISVTAGYNDTMYETARVHSNGFSGETAGTYFSAGASVTVRDGETGRPSDWYWGSTRFLNDLPELNFLGTQATKRALRKIGQKKIKSDKFDMIVENRSIPRLIGTFRGAMSGRSLQQKRSFLEGMLGKRVASTQLTLVDNPLLDNGMASRYFDDEGLAAKERVMIEKGILKNYYIDYYYGQKLGMESTSGSTSNLLFALGDQSLEEMIKSVDKGIFVTGFIGGNSNSTTGDFSFGIVGILIEKGELTQPVNEMNISGNARKFWTQLTATGNDPYPYSSYQAPSMLFADIDFSGI